MSFNVLNKLSEETKTNPHNFIHIGNRHAQIAVQIKFLKDFLHNNFV